MFVKEHCWFFYDHNLANTKQMEQRIIKMARALLAAINDHPHNLHKYTVTTKGLKSDN